MDNVPFNRLTDKHALELHGYLSDEDGSTDYDGASDFDELYALYKPPPLNIPQDKIVVIKAVRPDINYTELDDAQERKPDVAKKKKFSHRNKQKYETHSNVRLNNTYEVLQQGDNEDSSSNSDVNKYTHEEDVIIEVPKRKNKKMRKRSRTQKKILMKSNSRLNGCIRIKGGNSNELTHDTKVPVIGCNKESHALRGRYDEEEFTSDMNFFLDCLPWYFWNEDILTHIMPCVERIESHRSSWDHISTNRIYRSDKIIEQEYYHIVGSKICCYTVSEDKRTAALKNLLELTGAPLASYITNRALRALNSDTFLHVIGILIAAFIYTRCK